MVLKKARTAPNRKAAPGWGRATWPTLMSGLVFYILALYLPMLIIITTFSGVPFGRAVWCVLGFAVGGWGALEIGDRIIRRWYRREVAE